MWKQLSEVSLAADHVIVGGDFNHFEETDRTGIARERRMHKREVAVWHHMTLQYGLMDAWKMDSFRKMSAKEFTFDNGRSGPCSAISRIYKFLVSQALDTRGGRIEATTSVRKLSNHSPPSSNHLGTTCCPQQAKALLRHLPSRRQKRQS
jgi:hypothetical protein